MTLVIRTPLGQEGVGRSAGQSYQTIQWERGVPQTKFGVLILAEVLGMRNSLNSQAIKSGIIANLPMPQSWAAPTKSCVKELPKV